MVCMTNKRFAAALLAAVCLALYAIFPGIFVSAGAAGQPDPWLNEEAAAVLYRPTERRTADLNEATRTIRVLVHYGRTEFFVANGSPRGLEYEALYEYERFLNRKLHKKKSKITLTFIPVKFDELIPRLIEGKGDIAAGLMTVTEERKRKVAFTAPYIENVSEVLVGHAGAPLPSAVNDLSGKKVHVLRGSSFVQHLRPINGQLAAAGRAPIQIVEMPASTNADDILEMVNAGMFEYTVVDNFVADVWSRILPNIRVAGNVTIAKEGSIAWAVRHNNPELRQSLNAFIDYAGKHLHGRIGEVMRRYFKDTKFLTNPLKQEAFGRVKELSPFFKEASSRNKFDWLMMVAQGYQESQLDQNTVSPKGAIGIMQVLPATGKSVGFSDIRTARNNISAGVAYLDWIRKNYFNDRAIPADARVDFALAAYNAGPLRIESMRRIAKKRGLNPNIWFGNVERVALDKIGEEPVRYVANINRYYIAYRMGHEIEKERLGLAVTHR
jgi:membrane-bound lytic murein transglycosylase MltF